MMDSLYRHDIILLKKSDSKFQEFKIVQTLKIKKKRLNLDQKNFLK